MSPKRFGKTDPSHGYHHYYIEYKAPATAMEPIESKQVECYDLPELIPIAGTGPISNYLDNRCSACQAEGGPCPHKIYRLPPWKPTRRQEQLDVLLDQKFNQPSPAQPPGD